MSSDTPVVFDYAVFISYSHANNREPGRQWATWLHTALEQYEVPPDLVGTLNTRGEPVPASLYPVFRDEEELTADTSLSSNILQALKRSRMLVALCSPEAVASRFVSEEIRSFKELGRSDSVLALLIDGEPNASVQTAAGGAEVAAGLECLPHPLRYGVPRADGTIDWDSPVEPIAADTRPGGRSGQGWTTTVAYRLALARAGARSRSQIARQASEYERELQISLLKIIAGALGVKLRDLTKRDKEHQLRLARRRARNFAWLAAAFGVLTLLAIGGGIFAWRKKNDEALQRKTAEELLGFMLFDLRDKLAPLGRTDLLTSVAESARRYFKRFPVNDSNPTAQRERAALISNIGDIQFAQNAVREAGASYQAAFEVRRRLATMNPKSQELQHDLWSSIQKLGLLRIKEGRLPDAEAYLREALRVARDSAAAKIDGSSGQRDTAITLDNLAGVVQNEGRLDDAEAMYDEAAKIRQQRFDLFPRDMEAQRDLTLSLNHLGDVNLAKNELPKAESYFQQARQMREQLAVADSSSAEARRDLSVSLNKLGAVQQKQANWLDAEKSFQEALQIRLRLAADDPASAQAQRDLSASYHKLGDVQAAQKDFAAAEVSMREALRIREHLAAVDSASADARRVLCYTLDSLGEIQVAQGAVADAEKSHRQSLAITRSLAAEDPTNVDAQLNLAVSYNRLSKIESAQGRFEDAEKSIKESLKITERLAAMERKSADAQSYHCQSLECLLTLETKTKNLKEAEDCAAKVLALREQLAASQSAGSQSRRDLALCLNRVALLKLAENNPQVALACYTRSRDLLQSLFQKRLAGKVAFNDFVDVLRQMADVAESQGSWPQAVEFRRQEVDAVIQSRRSGSKSLAGVAGQKEAASAGGKLSFALSASGNFPEALKAAQTAVAEFRCLATEEMLAHALLLNNRWEEARVIYVAHQAEESEDAHIPWPTLIHADFDRLRTAGVVHPDMMKAETALGIAPLR